MNLFFLGASGFVGSHALRLARAAGHRAWGTRASQHGDGLLPFDLRRDRLAEVLKGLDRDPAQPSYGIVCASVRQIDQCCREREETRAINCTGTIAALEDFAAAGFKPVFVSTSFVFSGREGYYVEGDARGPVCEYGRQKAEVEQWMETRHPDGLVIRLDKIVGSDPAEEHLFSEWLRLLRAGKPLECIAGQIMSPTNVVDAAQAIVLACEHDLSGICHAANPEFFERGELARAFCRVLDLPGEVVSKPQDAFPFADPRPLKTYLDSSRFAAATGFRFTTMRQTFLDLKAAL